MSLPDVCHVTSKPEHFVLTQAQLDEYIRRLEEAERSISTAEAQISERDQRIVELERLLDCMGKVSLHICLSFCINKEIMSM